MNEMEARPLYAPLPKPTFILIISSLFGAFLLGWLSTFASQGTLLGLGEKSGSFLFLALSVSLCVLVVLADADRGMGLVILAATGLIAKTGMQLDIGPVRTSALELVIVVSVFLLLLRGRPASEPPRWPRLVIDRPLIFFVVLGIPALLVAFYRQVAGTSILGDMKGFLLYPLLSYLMVSWIRSERRLRMVLSAGVLAAAAVAGTAIQAWYSTGQGGVVNNLGLGLERSSGSFGIVNQYGFYLSSMALLALGLLAKSSREGGAIAVLGLPILLLGMALAGSRGVWLGLSVGLGLFFVVRRPAIWITVLVLGCVLAIWIWQLQIFGGRILRLDDNSVLTRVDLAATGWAVFQHYPVFGAGWGANFWQMPGGNLIAVDGLPQLHNDYLNLLTQVGLVGIGPFLWLWVCLIRRTVRALQAGAAPAVQGVLAGALAGIVALLVDASTDHVFWRPDIAGQVWWLTGLLLSGLALRTGPDEAGRFS